VRQDGVREGMSRRFGKTKLFTLNSKSPIVKKLLELESVLIARSLDLNCPSKNKNKEVKVCA